jgi:uncharacterized protein YdhG (YjbR/CyaY superfamily)
MAMPRFDSVAAYLASFPKDVQQTLRAVRTTLRKAVPRAEETVSYNIPTYKLGGRVVIYFAGWKAFVSVYPAIVSDAALAKAMAPYQTSKGTLQFPYGEPVPLKLIERLAKARAREARPAKKPRAKPKTRARKPQA